MKTRIFIISSLLCFATAVFGQESKNNYIWTLDQNQIGAYAGISGRSASVMSDNSGFLDARFGVVFNGKWTIGLTGSALAHDKKLDELVDDGQYHLYASYGGLFVERIFSVTDDLKFSVMIMSGQGTAYYQYDKEYRKDKVWSEEVIDKTTFGVQELSIEIQHRVFDNFWLGVTGSIRNTSPVELIGTSDGLFKKPGVGMTIKYGIF